MKCSMDGARINLARTYNRLIRAIREIDEGKGHGIEERNEALCELQQDIGIMLCMYDDKDEHCNMLAEKVTLLDAPGWDDDEEEVDE